MNLRYRNRRWHVGDGMALSPRDAALLFAVMCRPRVTCLEIIKMFWPNPDYEPECAERAVRNAVCTLNLKIWPAWQVSAHYDDGYHGAYSLVRCVEAEMKAA